MRTAFIESLLGQARRNPRIFLVVGDLGFGVVDSFAAEFPDRFLNVGVAEQNMMAVAAGLAVEGWCVFTYSLANFATLRCLEQIRNDVCYHRLNVTSVAVGAGLTYGNMGYSHHGLQDLALMRTMPNLTLLSPADPGETAEAVEWLANHSGPAYLRLGKAGEKVLHDVRGLHLGPLRIREGESDRALVATGSVLSVALSAADKIEALGVGRVAVFSCPWLKPIEPKFYAPLWNFRRLVSLEEHVSEGGLGELLAGIAPRGTEVRRLAISHDEISMVGSQEYLRIRSGLTADAAVRAVVE
jgi:transketolase